jgi:CRISPR-associated protein Cmr1
MEVTTPLFNGGADVGSGAGEGAGVRVPSLRGAMRFWFRALAGLVVGSDLRLLARFERDVFGGTDHASPVKLRIPDPPSVSSPGEADFIEGPDGNWILYLLGQGLGSPGSRTTPRRVTRHYVLPGETFTLQLRFTGDEDAGALAVASLWLLCAYGGVGARIRRGFGGLRITGADGPLPSPWDATSVVSPSLDHYETLTRLWPDGPAGKCIPPLRRAIEAKHRALNRPFDFKRAVENAWISPDDAAPAPPTYPVLSKRHTRARTSRKSSEGWLKALAHAGEQLRWFRADQDHQADPPYSPAIKTSEWDTVIRGNGDHFGLGALGLPVVYKEHNEVEAAGGPERGAEPLRRASPLWLRPVGADRRWRLLSFAFQGEFLPAGAAVVLRRPGAAPRRLRVEPQDVIARTERWIETMHQGGTFVRW